MAGDFLSQDEVDALLRGVNGDDETKDQEETEAGVRNYNLATQERIVRGRMPTLEIVNERFARLIRIGLFNFMRRSPEISVGPVRVLKYNEFIRNLVVPTNLNIMAMKPLRGNGLFIFDPSLVFAIIDNLFGGDGRFHTRVEGRDFTQTEQRIIARMLEVIREEFVKAWAPVFPLKPEYLRSEMHTQFANIATPSEIVVVSSFAIELGAGGGSLHICLPYATMEPIRDLLYSSMQGDQAEPDKRWVTMLKKQVQMADVHLIANLTEAKLTVEDIVELDVGDVIPIEIKRSVEACIDHVPIFRCSYGISGGRYSLKVEETLALGPEKTEENTGLQALLNKEQQPSE
jgi:flagellar motor switch protein FliM